MVRYFFTVLFTNGGDTGMSDKHYKYGATMGRYCPLQMGHEIVIQTMQERCERSLIFVGSANAPWSLPLFFDYYERTSFLRAIVPGAKLVPLPDFPGDNRSWLQAVKDLLLAADFPADETVFFGGSDEDVLVLSEEGGMQTHIVNRYDGTTPIISASQVRDALIHGRSLEWMINPAIREVVQEIWRNKWPQFMQKR